MGAILGRVYILLDYDKGLQVRGYFLDSSVFGWGKPSRLSHITFGCCSAKAAAH